MNNKDKLLLESAILAEKDEELNKEMASIEAATLRDGLVNELGWEEDMFILDKLTVWENDPKRKYIIAIPYDKSDDKLVIQSKNVENAINEYLNSAEGQKYLKDRNDAFLDAMKFGTGFHQLPDSIK